jgi:hypothetical protein
VPTVIPASTTCLVISGCQRAYSPTSKKVALRHSSARALSTDSVLPGQGPSSNVKTTSLSRRKSFPLRCWAPNSGPPVVSIWTMRVRPRPSGMSQGGMTLIVVAVVFSADPFCAGTVGGVGVGGAPCVVTTGGGQALFWPISLTGCSPGVKRWQVDARDGPAMLCCAMRKPTAGGPRIISPEATSISNRIAID